MPDKIGGPCSGCIMSGGEPHDHLEAEGQMNMFDSREKVDVDFIAESEKSSRRWTDMQKQLVDETIAILARRKPEFTANDVWAALPKDFPVNCGLPSRLRSACNKGVIENSGRTKFSVREKPIKAHPQLLTVWSSLIYEG